MKKGTKALDLDFTLLIPRKSDEFLKQFLQRVEEIVEILDDLPGKTYFYTFNESNVNASRFDLRIYFENEEDLLLAKLSL